MTKKIAITGIIRHRAALVRPEGYTEQGWHDLLLLNGLMRFKEGKVEKTKPYQMAVVSIKLDEKSYNVIEKHLPSDMMLKDFATMLMEDSLDEYRRKTREVENG